MNYKDINLEQFKAEVQNQFIHKQKVKEALNDFWVGEEHYTVEEFVK